MMGVLLLLFLLIEGQGGVRSGRDLVCDGARGEGT